MGILLGLPLRLLALLFALLRFLIPAALILFFIWLWRRQRQEYRQQDDGGKKGPDFKGPVYTVDYEDVKDEDGKRRD